MDLSSRILHGNPLAYILLKEIVVQVPRIWVLKVKGKNQFVYFDSHSGGFPGYGTFWQADTYSSLDAAMSAKGSDTYEIYSCDEVGMQYSAIQDPYEEELKKLKIKYGRE